MSPKYVAYFIPVSISLMVGTRVVCSYFPPHMLPLDLKRPYHMMTSWLGNAFRISDPLWRESITGGFLTKGQLW